MSYYDEINARSQVPLSILSGHGAICVACAEVDALRLALAASRDEAERRRRIPRGWTGWRDTFTTLT